MVLRVIVIEQIFDHHDEVVADVIPVALNLTIACNVFNHLSQYRCTVFSSFFSYFYRFFTSLLKDESFPPFSITLISSFTILLNSCNFCSNIKLL